jgi:hypothetical protein
VLLAHACGMPRWLAGLLGASITAPHLLGPFIARHLDTARDGRKVIAFSAVLHGVLLGAAALLLPVTAIWPAMLLFVSGIFGPMLTGGISSRLPSIAGPEQRNQRRAQSWDVASYGLSFADSMAWQLLPLGATAPSDAVRFMRTDSNATMVTEVQQFIDAARLHGRGRGGWQ